ncbi:Endonuclease/exonuclease/phosphatase, partial [Lenzites betulinus]
MRGAGGPTIGGTGEKWLRINQLMKENHIGILALQETHLTQDGAGRLNELFSDSIEVFTSPDPASPTGARGVALVVSKRALGPNHGLVCRSPIPGRVIEGTLKWGVNNTLTITNVYAPNNMNDNANFWSELEDDTTEGRRRPDILLGDFNMVEAPEDRQPSRPDPVGARSCLAKLTAKLNVVDGWRREMGSKKGFSFFQPGTGSQSRIDRIYVREELASRAADWKMEVTGIRTDHSLVSMTLANYAAPFIGQGRWVVPRAVLSDAPFLNAVVANGIKALEEMAHSATRTETRSIQDVYRTFKSEMKCIARRRAKELFAKWDRKIRDLKTKI